MNLYCPRCNATFDEIDPDAFESGLCGTCQGQLGAGPTAVDSPVVEGLVAMGFSDDSPVAAPLQLQLNNEPVDASADFEAITAARTEELAKAAAEAAAKKAAAEAAAAAAEAAAAEAAANAPPVSPESNESPALEMPTMPSVDGPPPADAPEAAAAQPKDAAAVPSSIDMPSFDFSMPNLPSFGMPSGADSVGDGPGGAEVGDSAATPSPEGAPPADAGAAPPAEAPPAEEAPAEAAPAAAAESAPAATAGDLPAHLQLPSFPQFDVNFDQPAEEQEPAAAPPDPGTPEGLPALPGQEQAGMAPPPLTPPGGMPAHLMPGALPQDGPPVAPPPEPEPEPEQPPEPDPLALPDLGLPDIPEEDAKREPTLLAQEAASELAQELAKRRSPLPIILGALVVLALIGGVAFWQRDTLIAAITGEAPGPVEQTAEQKAEAALADGLGIAKEAGALKGAAQKAKLKQAIKKYQEAIELKPKFAQAHVRLAVAFAKTNEKGKAVKHYEKFVEIDPTSKQAKEVKKIIDDWYKAQKEKGVEPKKDEPAPKKKKKKKR